jgi:hypothetical protein
MMDYTAQKPIRQPSSIIFFNKNSFCEIFDTAFASFMKLKNPEQERRCSVIFRKIKPLESLRADIYSETALQDDYGVKVSMSNSYRQRQNSGLGGISRKRISHDVAISYSK